MVETMLSAHERTILARVHEQQQAHATQLAAEMSRLLLDGMDRMLGGSKPDDAVTLPVLEKPPEESQRPRKLKIDIVGFESGQHHLLVRNRLNGTGDKVELNFVSPDAGSTYTPPAERQVILLTGRVPHKMTQKIKACGCAVVHVDRSVGDVVEAINNLVKNSPSAVTQ
jgi:hypothetical protein